MEKENPPNLETVKETSTPKAQSEIAGAIIIAGLLIAGAVLIKDNSYVPINSTVEEAESISAQIGLDVDSFELCVSSEKFKDRVNADIIDAKKAGIEGTPASFIVIDGVAVDMIKGAQSFETVKNQIDQALNATTNDFEVDIRPIGNEDHIKGNPNARVFIVEYSDFDCPYCKNFHFTMNRILEESNGEVAWVYRHFPILELHPNAHKKAQASECAWEQGGNEAFWKYADRLFGIISL